MWMLIYQGCFPLEILAHAEELNHKSCVVVKNDLGSGYSPQNELDLNCHFSVVVATLEKKYMCFQDYDYAV